MRADCKSGIQSTAELNGFWEKGIVEEMCFNKIRFAGAPSRCTPRCSSFSVWFFPRTSCEHICVFVLSWSLIACTCTSKKNESSQQVHDAKFERLVFSVIPHVPELHPHMYKVNVLMDKCGINWKLIQQSSQQEEKHQL